MSSLHTRAGSQLPTFLVEDDICCDQLTRNVTGIFLVVYSTISTVGTTTTTTTSTSTTTTTTQGQGGGIVWGPRENPRSLSTPKAEKLDFQISVVLVL